jgi:hypothetical protein
LHHAAAGLSAAGSWQVAGAALHRAADIVATLSATDSITDARELALRALILALVGENPAQ